MTYRYTPLLAALLFAPLHAQTANPLSAEVQQSYAGVKRNITRTAAEVPAEDYGFKPTPAVRSFAEVLLHVIQSQTHTCAAILGEEKTVTANAQSSKDELAAALAASFAVCDAAYAALTDATAAQMVETPRGKHTRLGMLVGNTAHDGEQYGTMAVYLRLKGLVPPSSQR